LILWAKAKCSCLVAEQDEKLVSRSAHCFFVATCSSNHSGSLQDGLYARCCSPCADGFYADKVLPKLAVWRVYMAWPTGLRSWAAGNNSGIFSSNSQKETVQARALHRMHCFCVLLGLRLSRVSRAPHSLHIIHY